MHVAIRYNAGAVTCQLEVARPGGVIGRGACMRAVRRQSKMSVTVSRCQRELVYISALVHARTWLDDLVLVLDL